MTGWPTWRRIIGFGYASQPVPGLDVAGTVVAVGSAVTSSPRATKCSAWSRGSFAEYSAAHEDKLHHKPANALFEQVATVRRSQAAPPYRPLKPDISSRGSDC